MDRTLSVRAHLSVLVSLILIALSALASLR